MSLIMLAFWALVVFCIVALFRATSSSSSRDRGAEGQARRILDERFARGQIDAQEYHSRRSLLPP